MCVSKIEIQTEKQTGSEISHMFPNYCPSVIFCNPVTFKSSGFDIYPKVCSYGKNPVRIVSRIVSGLNTVMCEDNKCLPTVVPTRGPSTSTTN